MLATHKPNRRAGRPKADDLAQRAADLLAITQALVLKLGYERTTLNMIARHAGVSKQTIYAKYGGKVGLVQAALQQMSDHGLSDVLTRMDDLPLYEGLLNRVRALIAVLRSANSLGLVMISMREWSRFPEIRDGMILAKQEHLVQPLAEYLERLKARREAGDIDCGRVAAMLVWSVSEELLELAATGRVPHGNADELESRARFITQFYADAIKTRV